MGGIVSTNRADAQPASRANASGEQADVAKQLVTLVVDVREPSPIVDDGEAVTF